MNDISFQDLYHYNKLLFHYRVREFERVLQSPVINLKELRSVCFNGIPDDSYSFRSLCWKLLLGYLPENQAKWKTTLQGKRECYQQLLGETLLSSVLKVKVFLYLLCFRRNDNTSR